MEVQRWWLLIASMHDRIMISALILTYNEELNIAGCIDSLPWRDDVHVLDSHSTDQTVALATGLGARVSARVFDGYASQRNAGLALPFKHQWVVMLDADERMTPELADEVERRLRSADANVAMFRVRRRDIFMGSWLRRSSGYPTWFPRVIRQGRVSVEREVNETYSSRGRVENMNGHIEHFPFQKGIEWWFDRHNRYSSAEAVLLRGIGSEVQIGSLLSRDPSLRRASLKALAYRLPFRPMLVFLYLYFLRLGFLDGVPGFHYASMRMAYEIMIDSKVAFIKRDS